MHDIGHGPLSHLFEKFTGQSHEDYSSAITRKILGTIPTISQEHIEFVLNVITPTRDIDQYMFSIVSNKATGIDVDRMDYLKRDARNTGKSLNFDIGQLFADSKITDGVITYSNSARANIVEFFRAREYMYRHVYLEPSIQAAELMMVDMLESANVPIPQTVDEYLQLDDSLFDRLVTTTDIGMRILRRDFYRLIEERCVGESVTDHGKASLKRNKDTIEILFKVGWGCVDHPWDHIKFHDNLPYSISPMPTTFEEMQTRVYTRADKSA